MRRNRVRSASEIREEQLEQDPDFREYWERTALARAVAMRLVGYRVEHQLTQTQLARMLGMRQPAVARLESGEHNPSFDTLLRLSGTLGIEFMLHIAPTTRPPLWADPTRSQARVIEKVRLATAPSEATVAASQDQWAVDSGQWAVPHPQ